MGGFYQVIKTIKGHRYLYRQRTFRKGGRVRTESHYVGPAGAGDVARVAAEQKARQAGPNNVRVRAMFKRLIDPQNGQGKWSKPWSEGGAVNTTFQKWEAFDHGLNKLGAQLIHDPIRNIAAYSPSADHLIMPPGSHFLDRRGYSATQAYYYALGHELTHWTGHHTRLNRKLVTNPQTPEELDLYAREEMVAEATALLILSETGRLPADISNHSKYFQNWHKATINKEEALDYAMDEAQRAASLILEAVNTTNR